MNDWLDYKGSGSNRYYLNRRENSLSKIGRNKK